MRRRLSNGRGSQHSAFSLVELLTVIFIISLLIGIIIPSISSARVLAKKQLTAKTIQTIEVGLEQFRQENEREFRQTNGYPPSFAHPPIPGAAFDPLKGEFPFEDGNPQVQGAHWLPAMLLGKDNLGFIPRSSVPTAIRDQPDRWYDPGEVPQADRRPRYLEAENLRLIRTKELTGAPGPAYTRFFDDTSNPGIGDLPVIADSFDQPILYYVANRAGRTSNMVEDVRSPDNSYTGGNQEAGVPYYFHEDNVGFTGTDDDANRGWDFGGGAHRIAESGEALTGANIADDTKDGTTGWSNRDTFAYYILDPQEKKRFARLDAMDEAAPLTPANADTFLLISAGPDGIYGNQDDVSNIPKLID